MLLNADDGGSRRCVLVTNNEVEGEVATQLRKQGLSRGDKDYEARGVFEVVTRPRCEAVITGLRPDGTKVPGEHLDGRPYSKGFEENLEFFRIDYINPDDVDLGHEFEAIFPALWLAAQGVGKRPKVPTECDMLVSPKAPYAFLFREEKFRTFNKAIAGRPDITHVWLVTDSEDAFAEMRSALPRRLTTSMLYRDYLRNFRINTRHNI